jgi:hypothetical protein
MHNNVSNENINPKNRFLQCIIIGDTVKGYTLAGGYTFGAHCMFTTF